MNSNEEKRRERKSINVVPVKWAFKSKEDSDGLIHLKSRNVVKG